MSFFSFLKPLGALVVKAFHAAKAAGLTDQLVQLALPYVREANRKFIDNDKRREWVVAVLVARKVPESIARLVVELAYRLYKAELEKGIAKIS